MPSGNSRNARLFVLCGLLALCCALVVVVNPLRSYRLGWAKALIDNDETQRAAESLEKWSTTYPNSAEFHFLLVRANRKLGRLDVAREHAAKAVELGYPPEELEIEQLLLAAQTGQIKSAEPKLREILASRDSHTRDICEALVNGYLVNYRFEDAARWLDAWEADFPNDPQPHISRGAMWQHLLLWNEAAAAFQRALELDPSRFETRLQLARSIAQLNRYEEARQLYQQCLAADPDNDAALTGLAHCELPLGKVDEAAEIFRRLAARDPENFDAQFGLGRIALAEAEPEEAVKWLEKAHRQQPRNVSLRSELATALRSVGRIEEAQAQLDYVKTANAAMDNVQELLRQVQADPDLVEPRYEAGVTLLKYASAAEGLSWLFSVLELDPTHAATHAALAEHYAESNDSKRAAHHRRMAAAKQERP